ncbi:MAG: hypothetical protein UV82_C0009G0018 [Candidatus Magasanikbacteria bacterium GW2011_GWD2_43_18]|nr:MAG: hypothetical protein UV18_C0004G0102 [Candidatus Magasanikbacteria bacterium GW2011_GWC2_42_27]KKT04279.1 MAG: hypothetical protein UV82_C0009G0018 [Candidatus Magasanikbacteria bacterium GW2011_GWD2_43_18]KKT24854.1 MAG: hypothetical protein UW10_C0018G0006 [Candidatus Magasanikbacteria bacterium GW2011_GWA2_43_9]HBB38377.1 Holliday junction resolvase RuvX [Candidatus Magasanikbacteria bacterium]HCC14145.1 Holliday junction resolvase RuvX [Candidatus Magasanikbacteria bacterium]
MNILAIDFGQKRIGLAWLQPGIDIVLPFGVIAYEKWKTELPALIESEGIQNIVIGNPLGMDGGENENTKRVQDFVDELSAMIAVPIELYDERFSSKQADAMGGTATRDEKSAMVILQSYLERKK